MKKAISIFITIALFIALAAAGCGKRTDYQPDPNQILTDLDTLAMEHRPLGSQGERNAAAYLQQRFAEMGYQVTMQPYEDEQGKTGTNVIAVKPAHKPEADILVLSAHHDSVPTSYGANDNASGAAALLAAAEMLKDIKTDTELRFISFTGEELGKKGSRYYTSTLTPEELERMVGCIQLDMLGGLGSKGTVAATMDGQENWLSSLLMAKDPSLTLVAEAASDHAAFQLAGVPSVLLMQNGRGYLYHSAADRADQLNLDAIGNAALAAVRAAAEIAGKAVDSYRDLAGSGYSYRQTRQNVIYFESSLADSEAYIGAAGELVDHKVEKGDGWQDVYDTYRYSMGWFDGQEPMNTYYRYRNGFLQNIEIRPAETGYSLNEVRELITAMYGDPASTGTDRQEQPYEAWRDELYSKYLTLTDCGGDFTVSVGKYSVGISNTLSSYAVKEGEAEITDPEDARVWEIFCSIIPLQYRQRITQFQLFTDGASNILAYTSPIREEDVTDNTRFCVTVDYYDVFDENGAERDLSKLTYTLIHEFGHVLLENETQVDLTLGENTHDPRGYVEGSFRRAFYDRFWKTLPSGGVGDYDLNPTNYVSRYGANAFHEDITDTFAVFVLGGKPVGDTVAEEKLLFFWEDPQMVELRSAIRQNLGLAVEEIEAVKIEP